MFQRSSFSPILSSFFLIFSLFFDVGLTQEQNLAEQTLNSSGFRRKLYLFQIKKLNTLEKNKVVLDLVNFLKTENEEKQYQVSQIIQQIGPHSKESIQAIATLLQTPNKIAQHETIYILGEQGELAQEFIPQLKEKFLVKSETNDLQFYVLNALAKIAPNSQETILFFKQALQNKKEEITQRTFELLVEILKKKPVKEFLPFLTKHLNAHPHFRVREKAAQHLGDLKVKESLPLLQESYEKEKDWMVRSSILKAIAKINPNSDLLFSLLKNVLINRQEHVFIRGDAVRLLENSDLTGEDLAQLFFQILADETEDFLIKDIFEALKKRATREPELIPILLNGMKSEQPIVFQTIAKILGTLGDNATKALVPLLETLRKDKDPKIQSRITMQLAIIGSYAPKTHQHLITSLKDAPPHYRAAIAFVFSKISPGAYQAIPAMTSLTKATDLEVKLQTINAIGKIVEEFWSPSRSDLWNQYHPDDYPSYAGINSLKRDLPFAISALVLALKDPNKEVRQNAVLALSRCKTKSQEITQGLLRTLKDPEPEVILEVLSAISFLTLKGEEVSQALYPMLKIENIEIQLAALEAYSVVGATSEEICLTIFALQEHQDSRFKLGVNRALNAMKKTAQKVILPLLLGRLNMAKKENRSRNLATLWYIAPTHLEAFKTLFRAINDFEEQDLRQQAQDILMYFMTAEETSKMHLIIQMAIDNSQENQKRIAQLLKMKSYLNPANISAPK